MADLSSEDRRRIEEAVAEAVAEAERAGPATTEAATAAPLALPDPRDFFCDNWPTAKRVLEFLLRVVPDKYKRPVEILIAAGDRLHQLFCG